MKDLRAMELYLKFSWTSCRSSACLEKGRRGRLSPNLRDDSSIDVWKYQKEKRNLKGKRKMKNTHIRREDGGEVRKRV